MNVPALQGGSFQSGTVSYTSTQGAAASLSFQGWSVSLEHAQLIASGSSVFVFGPTGPQFGSFQVEVDGQSFGTFNSSTTISTFDNLLFFASDLNTASTHTIVMTNEDDGKLFAIDYVTVVRSAGSATGSETSTNIVTTGAVFPTTGSSSNSRGGGGNGAAGAAIGISVGVIAAIVSFSSRRIACLPPLIDAPSSSCSGYGGDILDTEGRAVMKAALNPCLVRGREE